MITAANVKPFVERVGRELQRAERYRIFLSLIVLDFNSVRLISDGGETADVAKLVDLVTGNTRSVDHAALVETGKVAVLLPETPRQGAEGLFLSRDPAAGDAMFITLIKHRRYFIFQNMGVAHIRN